MKKSIFKTIAIATVFVSLFAGCGAKAPEQTQNAGPVKVVVGATADPHGEMLQFIVEDLKEKNIELEIKDLSDYAVINKYLAEKQIDANFFQHTPYFQDFLKNSGAKLVSLGPVHSEPMGIYSDRITTLEEIADGAVVGIPNDATNGGRALLLLESKGLLKLNDGVGTEATVQDIIENPKNLKIVESEAAALPRTLDSSDFAVINGNYAIASGLNPLIDAISLEENDSPYANIFVVREEDQNKPELQEVYKALTSEKMKKHIIEKYQGAVVPAF